VSSDPLAFAAGQVGDGAWMPLVAAGAAQSYPLIVTGERYGLAYGCDDGSGNRIWLTVIQATVSETTRVTVACLPPAQPTPNVNVTIAVAGLTGTESAELDVAGLGLALTATMPTYRGSFLGGTHDLFVRRYTAPPTFDRMIRRNDVTIAEGTALSFDFATEGFAPDTKTVTFQGATASERRTLLGLFLGTGGTQLVLELDSDSSGRYFALPASQLRSGDYHELLASAIDSATIRRVRRRFTTPTDFSAVLPTVPAAAAIVVGSATPYLRPRITAPAGLDADRFDVTFSQTDNGGTYRWWSLQATRGWRAASGDADYLVPDLSGVSGFQPWWGLMTGPATSLQETANWSDAGVADLLRVDQSPSELIGHEQKIAQRLAALTF